MRALRASVTYPVMRDGRPRPDASPGPPARPSVRVDAHGGGGRRPVALGDPQVVGLPVDDFEADDLPGRELGAGAVLAPQPQCDGGRVVQVAGLFPVADLRVVACVAAGQQEGWSCASCSSPRLISASGVSAPDTLRVMCQSLDCGCSSFAVVTGSRSAVSDGRDSGRNPPSLRHSSGRGWPCLGAAPRARSSHRRPPVMCCCAVPLFPHYKVDQSTAGRGVVLVKVPAEEPDFQPFQGVRRGVRGPDRPCVRPLALVGRPQFAGQVPGGAAEQLGDLLGVEVDESAGDRGAVRVARVRPGRRR